MKFRKEDIRDAVYGFSDLFEIIFHEFDDHTRWNIHSYTVLKHTESGRFYEVHWSKGATEYQDCDSFEYEPDELELDEVEPREVTVTRYFRIED